MVNVITATWKELDAYVDSLLPFDRPLELLAEKPFTTKEIDELLASGCLVRFSAHLWEGQGLTFKTKKNNLELRYILLNYLSSPYDRDKILFHECAHIKYNICFDIKDKNIEAKVEWIGRQWRADPTLLKHLIHSFELKPYIYDKASYQAFASSSPEGNQLLFPFEKNNILETFMD